MGEAPSRVLREGLTKRNLNQLFSDAEVSSSLVLALH